LGARKVKPFTHFELFAVQYDQRKSAVHRERAAKTIGSYAMFITNMIRAFVEWQRYRAAVRELSAMDDRSLNDIGLKRSMIQRAARSGRNFPPPSHAISA